jgi:G3E family GTPase
MNDTSQTDQAIQAVPTNIITGFLGAGKTSAILQLLKFKPESERWAVLVNEFGEIGIDGSLFGGQHSEDSGVFIREVPGGCMCCAAGLPMHIALNQLLQRAKPDRLLIEPTGLGHPVEVLEVLLADHYQAVLSVEKIVTLVDARKLVDSRYTEHATFNQQIDIADLVVGNKADLYQVVDKERLLDYVKGRAVNKSDSPVSVLFAEQGNLSPSILRGKTAAEVHVHHHHHQIQESESINDQAIPDSGYLKVENEGEGFRSVGWRFDPDRVFDRGKLFAFLSGLIVERMKAVFITEDGIFGYNLTPDALTEMELDDCLESRIEIIAAECDDSWHEQLLACIDS